MSAKGEWARSLGRRIDASKFAFSAEIVLTGPEATRLMRAVMLLRRLDPVRPEYAEIEAAMLEVISHVTHAWRAANPELVDETRRFVEEGQD